MAKFRINYDKVISQANSIDDLANDLQRKIDELTDLQSMVRKEWIGPASSAFQKKLSTLISDMKSTKSDMDSVASQIKSTARNIQREDERLAHEAEEKL